MPSVEYYYRPHPPFKIISDEAEIQDHYVESRRKGTAHKMAEMFAYQQSPALKTATRWIAGHDPTITEHTPDIVRDRLLSSAREAGVNPGSAVYKSGLARAPGDPEAWVSSEEDCKRVAERRGMKLEGGIEFTPPGYDDIPTGSANDDNYRVAPDIVDDAYTELKYNDPERAREPGVKEELADLLSGKET